MNYKELDEEGQIRQVEKIVPSILAQYGIESASTINVNHSFNSSFKVTDNEGETYALRINLGSGKSEPEVLAEMQWLEQLSLDPHISAPKPRRTTNQELLTTTFFEPLNTNFTAVLFDWIEGEEVGDEPTNEQLFELGQSMARLQIFAKDLAFTEPAFLPTINRTLLNSNDNLTLKQPEQINDGLYADILKALDLADKTFTKISHNQQLIPIHADLHMGNVIQTSNGLAIIDFDDAGIGLPIQDLAISNYYIREDKEREKHLFAGFSSVLELPKIAQEDYEVLLLSRLILLVNAVLEMTSAEIIEFLPTFLERTQKRLDKFFETGEFLRQD